MKPLVIFHKNCLDGAGSALAAWLKFGEEAEYRAAQYGDSNTDGRGVLGTGRLRARFFVLSC